MARRGAAIAGVVAAAIAAAAAGGGAGYAAARYVAPLPPLTVALALPAQVTVGTAPAPLPVPAAGSFALSDSLSGGIADHDAQTVRPIASIAKTMTALAILRDSPLAPDAEGPVYTVTAADVALLRQVIAEDGSHVDVEAGERLSERQLLLGLMLPSANNFAIMLARWLGGGDAAFVAQLNRQAIELGMTYTHFDDPDGLSSRTVSTAADLVLLGRAAVEQPTLAAIMAQPRATMPDGRVVTNIDPLVGSVPGWLGIKTGHTVAGGYCLLFAARRDLGAGPAVTVVGAVLGQTTRQATFSAARSAVEKDFAAYAVADPATLLPSLTGTVKAAWGAQTAVAVRVASGVPFLVRGGTAVRLHFSGLPVTSAAAGTTLATVSAAVNGSAGPQWTVVGTGDLAGPPWWWRLRR